MKSNYANQWFGKVSMQGFVQMIESEIAITDLIILRRIKESQLEI